MTKDTGSKISIANEDSPALPCYEEIIRIIHNAPLTYLPAILITAVDTCIERKVFKDGDTLVKVVEKVVKKAGS